METCMRRVIDRHSQPKNSQCKHVLDSLMQELKTFNVEQKQTVDNISLPTNYS